MRIPLLSIFGLLVFTSLAGAEPAIGPDVERSLTSGADVAVVVTLDVPLADQAPGRRRAAIAATVDRTVASVGGPGFTITRRFRHVPALAARVTEAGLARLRREPAVRAIDVDPVGTGDLAVSVPQIHADVLHQTYGLLGAGVTVAVLDSGIDRDHPDFAGALVDEQCFCGFGGPCCPNGGTTQSGPGAAEDDHGHGTHVTSILAGRGTVAATGVAPAASVVAVKVLNADNAGRVSDWIAALDWVIDVHPEVRAVNMSLCASPVASFACDTSSAANIAMASAIDTLTAAGTRVFAASCNAGLADEIGSPGCIRNAVAVGAVDSSDAIAEFSNSSEELDLLAPGVDITASWIGGGTAVLSGTSMAAPQAAGVAALLNEARPGITSTALLQALVATGKPITDARTGRIRPRIDAEAAYLKLVGCGDGVLGTLEQCDDGNLIDGDGCSGACELECPPAPVAGCRRPISPGKSLLQLKNRVPDSKDSLIWKWTKGETTPLADFGDPSGSDAYRLCVYDATGVRAGMTAPAGGSCGTRPCWSSGPTGFKYKDNVGTPDGIAQLQLKAGTTAGRASIMLKGKGPALRLPLTGLLASPITVQLRRPNGPCWEAVFSAPFAAQDERSFKAKSD
jgi:cysteine-rich repeat protein